MFALGELVALTNDEPEIPERQATEVLRFLRKVALESRSTTALQQAFLIEMQQLSGRDSGFWTEPTPQNEKPS